MTREDAINEYTERFGGFPTHLMLGAEDSYVVWQVQRALRTGEEIEAPEEDEDY
jgi:hypothetical protein